MADSSDDAAPLIVIFGAAVRADGAPSPALARRIAYGRRAADRWPSAPILCSGAAAPGRPSEARVIALALTGAGVSIDRLILDELSFDTLQSVAASVRIMRRDGFTFCVACSDRYHLPRIQMTFAALGARATAGPTAPGRGGATAVGWWRMQAREVLALPYDVILAWLQRRTLVGEP